MPPTTTAARPRFDASSGARHVTAAVQKPAKVTKKPRVKSKPALSEAEAAAAEADAILRALGSSLIAPPVKEQSESVVASPIRAKSPYKPRGSLTPAERKEKQQIRRAHDLEAFYGSLRGSLQHNNDDLRAIVDRSTSRLARELAHSPVQSAPPTPITARSPAVQPAAPTVPAVQPVSSPRLAVAVATAAPVQQAVVHTPPPPPQRVTAPFTAPAPQQQQFAAALKLSSTMGFATPTPRRPTHASSLAVQFGGLSLASRDSSQPAPVGAVPSSLPIVSSTPMTAGKGASGRGHLLHGKVVEAARATAAWLAADANSWHQAHRFINECMADFANPPKRKDKTEDEWRQWKLAKLMESLKADPELASCRSIKRSEPMDGWTPLHAAAFKGNLAVVQALVEWSTDTCNSSSKRDAPHTPCDTVRSHQSQQQQQQQQQRSISTWDLDLQGRTALALAAMQGHYTVVDYLKGVMEAEAREGDIVGANAPVDLAGLTPLAWHVKSKAKIKRVVDKLYAVGDPSICPATPVDTRSGTSRSGLSYGYADAPGWRISMEDATCHHTPLLTAGVHACSAAASETGLFGVFDGHGGGFTSTFVAEKLLTCLQSTAAWRAATNTIAATAAAAATTAASSSAYNSTASAAAGVNGRSSSSSSSVAAAAGAVTALTAAAVTEALQCAFLAVDALLEAQPRMALTHVDAPDDGKRYKAADSSGSTGIVAVVMPDFVAVANAGDSRAIVLAPQLQLPLPVGGTAAVTVTALSEDHTAMVPTEQARIVAAGGDMDERRWVEDGLERSVLRIKYSPAVRGQSVVPSRSFGDFYYKQNSIDGQKLAPELQVVTAFPEVRVHNRAKARSSSGSSSAADEYLLLACDGLWDVFTSQDAGETFWRQLQAVTLGRVPSGEDLAAACDAMVAEALARKSEDNITVMAVRLVTGTSGSSSSAVSSSSSSRMFDEGAAGLVPPGFMLGGASPDE